MEKQISWVSDAGPSGVDVKRLRKDIDRAVSEVLANHGIETDGFVVAVFDRGSGRGTVARLVKRLVGSRTLNNKSFIFQVARKDPVTAQKIASLHESALHFLNPLHKTLGDLVWTEREVAKRKLGAKNGSQPVRKTELQETSQ